ncbi:MAG: hypothetical protein JRI23_17360 [Deltaproteobacteria bacterium]|jgi:hypothetical protein|nr:hypothetical protein [Deltaproteobacteria bacterium]MBW2533586.1 hypothetical protein [Deltaproteobacteria bacterium]
MHVGAVRIPVLVAIALAAAACDDETQEPVALGPTGPPSMAFVEPQSHDVHPACEQVGDEPDARVPLLVETSELVLRPPDACGSYVQCGHLALYVDDVLNNESSVPAIDLLLRKLGDRYHDGRPLPATGEPDVLHLRVEVQDDAGEVMLDHDGEELSDELELITVTMGDRCPRHVPSDSP